MAEYKDLTDDEYAALDELWTKTTPKTKPGTGGVFTENRARMLLLDEMTIRILNAQATAVHQTPTEFVTRLIRQGIAAAI